MESLRVLPPVPMTFRKVDKADYLDGIYIPAGTLLYIPVRLLSSFWTLYILTLLLCKIRVINSWKTIWGPDAEEFRPERWSNLPKSWHSQYSFMSFIVGPHACIGKTMAIIEMKTVLAWVLRFWFVFIPSVHCRWYFALQVVDCEFWIWFSVWRTGSKADCCCDDE